MSTVVAYNVDAVESTGPGAAGDGSWPRRLVGSVLTAQELVNMGAFFQGASEAVVYHDGRTWTLTLRPAGESDHWNATPHGRDEGEYETEAQVNPVARRLHIP